MNLKNNFEYLLEILSNMKGEEVSPNTFINISEVVHEIVVNCNGGGGGGDTNEITKNWRDFESATPDYAAIQGEPFYLRAVQNNTIVDFSNVNYKLGKYADKLTYSYDKVNWNDLTNLQTITMQKDDKIYLRAKEELILGKTNNDGVYGFVPSSKGLAVGGNLRDLQRITHANPISCGYLFYSKNDVEGSGLAKIFSFDDYFTMGKVNYFQNFLFGSTYFKYFSFNTDFTFAPNNGGHSLETMFAETSIQDIPSFSIVPEVATRTFSAYRFAEYARVCNHIQPLDFTNVSNMERAFSGFGSNPTDWHTFDFINAHPTNLGMAFYSSHYTRDIKGLYTDKCKNFDRAFSHIHGHFHVTLDLTSLQNKDTNFRNVFEGSYNDEITITNIPTGLTNIGGYTFSDWQGYKINGDLSNFGTLENMEGWFANAGNLQEYPATLDTTSNKNFNGFLKWTSNLDCTTLPAEMNTSNGENFGYMFEATGNSQADDKRMITAPLMETSKGKNFEAMFIGQDKLVTIPKLNLSSVDNVWNSGYMFNSCTSLQNITFEGSINSHLTFETSVLSYDSIKSILTAAANNTIGGGIVINLGGSQVVDANGEILSLVSACQNANVEIRNLIIN